jgi:hypothetical protein
MLGQKKSPVSQSSPAFPKAKTKNEHTARKGEPSGVKLVLVIDAEKGAGVFWTDPRKDVDPKQCDE